MLAGDRKQIKCLLGKMSGPSTLPIRPVAAYYQHVGQSRSTIGRPGRTDERPSERLASVGGVEIANWVTV